jgi:hypothetical protein
VSLSPAMAIAATARFLSSVAAFAPLIFAPSTCQ